MSGLGDMLAGDGFKSEAAEALEADAAGDPWPLAILECRGGDGEPLAELIRRCGVPQGTAASAFVADVISGRFKPTKADKGIKRNTNILAVVSMLQYIMEARREGRMAVSEGRANNLNTMDDVYRVAAKKFNLTSSGVQKVVERNRRRIRERDRREIAAQTKDG